MIKLLFPLPKKVTLACSGGVDSIAVADFLSRKHKLTIAFFHHGTVNSNRAHEFLTKFCQDRKLPLVVDYLSTDKPKKQSQEEFWRIERYKFLRAIDEFVITAHHLNDCVETYIWSSLHGTPKVPDIISNNIIRPFLTTHKDEFINWCVRKNVSWCEDYSNQDVNYTRNYIRTHVVPHALKVNPGLFKTVKKIVETKFKCKQHMV